VGYSSIRKFPFHTTPLKNVLDIRYEKFVPHMNLKSRLCCTPIILFLIIVIPLRVYPVSQWVVTGLTVHKHVYCVSSLNCIYVDLRVVGGDSTIGKATMLWTGQSGFQIPVGGRDFFCSKTLNTGSGACIAPLFNGHRASLLG
jgi:hypothetical protein